MLFIIGSYLNNATKLKYDIRKSPDLEVKYAWRKSVFYSHDFQL